MGIGRVNCAGGELNPSIWITRNLKCHAPRGAASERFSHTGRNLGYLITAHARTLSVVRSTHNINPAVRVTDGPREIDLLWRRISLPSVRSVVSDGSKAPVSTRLPACPHHVPSRRVCSAARVGRRACQAVLTVHSKTPALVTHTQVGYIPVWPLFAKTCLDSGLSHSRREP